MYRLQFISNSQIDPAGLERVIAIKQTAWPYPKESQLKWIRDNLSSTDIHIFLMYNGEDVAYLNIAWVNVLINNKSVTCAGIGNVCSRFQGMGYGKCLINSISKYIYDNNYIGILFCKDKLVEFYQKYNWELVKPEKVTLPYGWQNINTMVLNIHDIDTIVYVGRNF